MDTYLKKRPSPDAPQDSPIYSHPSSENHSLSDEIEEGEIPANTSITDIQKLCSVCFSLPHKYKCPGCSILYCCLNCYKSHMGPNCTGKTIPTKFVSLKSYNAKNLSKDFDYLSDMLNCSNKVKKKLSILEENLSKQKELMRYKILRMNAKKRNVNITFAPSIISRHRENISFYFTKEKIIYWVFEQLFYVCVDENKIICYKYNLTPTPQSNTIEEMLEDFPWDNEEIVIAFSELLTPKKLSEKCVDYNCKDLLEESESCLLVKEEDNDMIKNFNVDRSDNKDLLLQIENTYYQKDLIDEKTRIKRDRKKGIYGNHPQSKIGGLNNQIIKQLINYRDLKYGNQKNSGSKDQDRKESIEDSKACEELEEGNDQLQSNTGKEKVKRKHSSVSCEEFLDVIGGGQLDKGNGVVSYVRLDFAMKIEEILHSLRLTEYPTITLIPKHLVGYLNNKKCNIVYKYLN